MRKLSIQHEFLRPTEIHSRERELVEKIRVAGIDIMGTTELLMTNEPYPEIIPILLDSFLQNVNGGDDAITIHTVRALTCKEAKSIAFNPIYSEYIKSMDTNLHGVKYAMANAIQYLAEKKDIPKLIKLVLDKKNGATRVAFIDKVAGSVTKENILEIKKVLETLSKDQDEGIRYRANKALQRKKFQDEK